jgi:hypothetical protein
VEAASDRNVGGAWNIAFQHNVAMRRVWVGSRYRRKQGLRIGVVWRGVNLPLVPNLHDTAEVHDRDAVRHMAYHRQVVRNKQVGDSSPPLQVLH